MRLKIMTVLGEFYVILTYQPTGEDPTLINLTRCVNDMALKYIQRGYTPEQTLDLISEGTLEKKLFDSLRVPAGSGPRVTLNLKNKEIQVHNH